MLKVDVKVTKNRLGNLAPAVRREVAAFVHSHAEETAQDAQRRAPVRTGELRDGIKHERRGEMEAEVVSEAPHSIFVNYGTSKQAANPFFSAAVDMAATRWYPGLAAAIKRGLEEGAG